MRRTARGWGLIAVGVAVGCFGDPPAGESDAATGAMDGTASAGATTTGGADGMDDGSAAGDSTGGGMPAAPIDLFERACGISTVWTAYAGDMSGDLFCEMPGLGGALLTAHPNLTKGEMTYPRVIEATMPMLLGGEVNGEFFDLNLDDFQRPMLRGAVACHEAGCDLDYSVEIYGTDADQPPLESRAGHVATPFAPQPFEIELTDAYASATSFSILVYAAVAADATGTEGSHVYWIDLKIEDGG